MHSNRTGFTLIELMVVVALVAIMLMLAVPSFATFISNYRATAAINDLLQAVTLTRAEALKRGRRVTLAPVNADWKQGWTIFVDVNANQIYGNGDELIYQHGPLPATMTVAGANATNTGTPFANLNYVAFGGNGYPQTGAGAPVPMTNNGIYIANTSSVGSTVQKRTLCLSWIGRPRIVQNSDPCTSG